MSRICGIKSDGGYPAGAEFDSRAPWNEPSDIDVDVTISVTYHSYKKVTVPPNYTDLDLREAVREQITLPGDLCDGAWEEDEMEVVE